MLPLMRVPLSADETALLIEADAGHAKAQGELAAVFHRLGEMKTAVYWWQLAAAQGDADAMQWLGRCHAAGEGVEQDERLALMWISKAAAAGHAIAAAQLDGLLHRAGPK
ncbi:MAG: sel1 repeat family protein [Proteobacteria bacterium]|nr:sel1 repeat family protein [Pseudomonadota bacterium]